MTIDAFYQIRCGKLFKGSLQKAATWFHEDSEAQSTVIKGILIDPFILIHEILRAENREIYYISNMIGQKI